MTRRQVPLPRVLQPEPGCPPYPPYADYAARYSYASAQLRSSGNARSAPVFADRVPEPLPALQEESFNYADVEGKSYHNLANQTVSQSQSRRNNRRATPDRVVAHNAVPASQDSSAKSDARREKPRQRQRRERPMFDEYMDREQVERGVADGSLYKGVLRINKKRRSDAYVTCPGLPDDIYLLGERRRNRALDGDVVAVQLVDANAVLREKQQQDQKRNARRDTDTPGTIVAAPSAVDEDDQEPVELDEPEGDVANLLIEQDAPMPAEDAGDSARLCGQVVCILERGPSTLFTGRLCIGMPLVMGKNDKQSSKDVPSPSPPPPAANGHSTARSQHAKDVWFHPSDNRVPFLCIPIRHCPPEFLAQPDKYANTLYVASMVDWPAAKRFPFGRVERELGPVGNILIESEAILLNNHVDASPFAESVLRCLPRTPWQIPDDEYARRRDCRAWRIFTIDPKTAKDLDDAVSVRALDGGEYEVGVHIADVSHFVRQNTPLDSVAAERCTTVYLVQKAIPMLPSLLCEQLCSLNPDVERLAFSVVWRMSADARVRSTWFGRTVIRSCARLAYEDAQDIIEGRSFGPHVRLSASHNETDIAADILTLHKLSSILRERRFENGALTMSSMKLGFGIDADTALPNDCTMYVQQDSNRLIEEFMLLANMSVAERIACAFPDQSLLRRHPPPREDRINELVAFTKHLGLQFDTQSAAALHLSFARIADPEVQLVVKQLGVRTMQRAQYFCTGMLPPELYRHYALNVSKYTHFTSPIRRYADVIVHRLLDCAIRTVDAQYECDTVEQIACACNAKKEHARQAQEASSRLYLCVYLSQLVSANGGEPLVAEALVLDLGEKSMEIVVVKYAIEERFYYDRTGCERFEVCPADRMLRLWWQCDSVHPNGGVESVDDAVGALASLTLAADGTLEQTIKPFSRVPVSINVSMATSPPELHVKLLHPHTRTTHPLDGAPPAASRTVYSAANSMELDVD